MSASLLLERFDIVQAAPPALLDAGATTGDYVSLKNHGRIGILFLGGVGTAGDDPTVSFFQATDVSGTGAKDLDPIDGKVWKKQAATSHAAVGVWTDAFSDVTDNDITNATGAEQVCSWWVEFEASDLDVANDFDCVRVDVDDPGTNAQPGAVIYILGDPSYETDPDAKLSPIAD